MDILKMLANLHEDRKKIEEAIIAIEQLAAGTRGKRRGRPPKWMSAANTKGAAAETGKNRTVSAAGRKRMADAQKARWAAKKAQADQERS
jgi:hypothetical protein